MLDDVPPPAKRMKYQKKPYSHANKENHDPNLIQTVKPNDVRKRKVPTRKPTEPHILDLNAYVLLEVFDYLPLKDLCSLAETSVRMQQLARLSFEFRANNADIRMNNPIDLILLTRLVNNFSSVITSLAISTRR